MIHATDFCNKNSLLIAAQWTAILSLPLMLVGVGGTEASIGIVGGLFIIQSALSRQWSWLKTPWVSIAIILWAYMVARGFFTIEWQSSVVRSFVWIRYPIFAAALCFWVLRDHAQHKKILWALLLLLAFLIIDTFIQYATGTDILGRALIRSEEHVRLTGPFSNPRVGITIAWIVFPALAVLLAREHRLILNPHNATSDHHSAIAWRAMGLLATVCTLAAVFIAGERMALLFTLMGLGLCFITIKRARLTLIIAAALGAATLFAIITFNPALKERQIGESSHEIVSFWDSPYGKLWQSSLRMLEANMAFGVGPKQFRTLCHDPRYSIVDDLSDTAPCLLHPHNIYMEWLAETGLVGFGLFIALITHWLHACWQARRAIYADPLLAGLVIALLIRLWPLSSTTSQFSGWSAGPFWFMTGWLLVFLAHHTPKNASKE